MSLLVILHILFIWSLLLTGFFVYKKYKYSSWIFFLITAVLLSFWYFLYVLVFSTSISEFLLLLMIKVLYALSSISYYSMVFFVKYFNTRKNNIPFIKIFSIFWLFALSIIGTSFYISWLEYLPDKWFYYETFWPWYNILAILYGLFFPIFWYVSYKSIKWLSSINYNRLKYIAIWFFIFVLSTVLVLIVLPILWIILLEQYVILLVIPFVIWSVYAIHNYNFADLQLKTWSILINMLALAQTFMILYFVKFYTSNLWNSFSNLWWLDKAYWFGDFILWLVIFLPIRAFLMKLFLGKNKIQKISQEINYLKKSIPYINNIWDLNSYIQSEFARLFKIKFVKIEQIKNKKTKTWELCTYFMNDNHKFFMNDFVFIQENKHNFNEKKIFQYINKESFFVFPLKNNNNDVVALFSIWKKPFKEQFSKDELNIFEDLKVFLEGHLKYIEIHKKIHDLSVNLDKQVDKQTIEYNQLINKQKEFISYVSHEVKWPIASSIFQIDSIIEEVIDDELNKKDLLKELHVLNHLLLKTWELVNKLFSIQQFELNSDSLFKERVHLINLLNHEIGLFQKIHPWITFITDFDESLKYLELDKVQFKQVIDNLINNAIKVINSDEWEISISCKKIKKEICIEIEDNWKGFSDLDIKKIFDKYSTGKWSSVWLWMGLYLCKTIVELHWWNIQAAFWKKLWWAKIIIKIPII